MSEFMNNRPTALEVNLEQDKMTFSDLPIEILGKIVEKLGFPSQMKLRKVSSGLRDIVDQVKPSIDEFSCSFYEDNGSKYSEITVQTKDHSPPVYYRRYDKEVFFERVFDGVKIILSNPRLKLIDFKWKNHLSPEIDEKLMEILKSLNHKIETVYLIANLNGESMIDLLKAFKPGTLEYIYLRGKSIDINRIAQLDQWKMAKSVDFTEFISDFSNCLHHFQHFEQVFIYVESLSMDDILFVKKLLIQNDTFKYFYINANDKPSESEIVETLGLSEPYFDEYNMGFYRRCDIPESNDYLKVLVNQQIIYFHRETEESY